MNAKTLVLRPRISENAYRLSRTLNTYTFDVPTFVSKQQIADAVAEQFDVSVVSVNTVVAKGKVKRTYTKRDRATGRDVTIKKAYVRIKNGDHLPIFEAEEKEEAEQAKKNKKEKQ